MAEVLGLGRGVPDWLAARVRQGWPDANDHVLACDNSDILMEAASGEVARWITGDMPVTLVRYLDCFELFCGAGGVTNKLITKGLKARGFDRPRRVQNAPHSSVRTPPKPVRFCNVTAPYLESYRVAWS